MKEGLKLDSFASLMQNSIPNPTKNLLTDLMVVMIKNLQMQQVDMQLFVVRMHYSTFYLADVALTEIGVRRSRDQTVSTGQNRISEIIITAISHLVYNLRLNSLDTTGLTERFRNEFSKRAGEFEMLGDFENTTG